jgi:O-antigen/teichoic acid export membrane protein
VERLGRTAQLQVLQSVAKLAAVVGLVSLTPFRSAGAWGAFYLTSSVITSVVAVWLVNRELARPRLALARMRRELVEGFFFSISLSAQNAYNDIDKTMLARLTTLAVVGNYGMAYRLIDIAFTPVRSLLWATNARFFQHGAAGARTSLAYARRLLPAAALYAIGAGLVLCLVAPLVPRLLGPQYQDAVAAIRWLAPLPLLKSIHYLAADALTGAGYQGRRSLVQVLVAAFNVTINLWLIPAYSWVGAAWASLLSDGLLVMLLWMVLGHVIATSPRSRDAIVCPRETPAPIDDMACGDDPENTVAE